MDEAGGSIPLAHGLHPRARASLDEALADERSALAELLAGRGRAAGDQDEMLDMLITRKRQIIAALSVLRAQLDQSSGAQPARDHPVTPREDANDG